MCPIGAILRLLGRYPVTSDPPCGIPIRNMPISYGWFGAPSTATLETTTPSAVIDRISLVLDAFEGPGRLTLAQIVRRTGLPRSSAHRMLERLVQLRWLRRSGRDYELGMRLVELGSLAVHQDRLVRAASPLLGELHRGTGLGVDLAVGDGRDGVCPDQF